MNRRKFMTMLGLTPVAAPVVAKEALSSGGAQFAVSQWPNARGGMIGKANAFVGGPPGIAGNSSIYSEVARLARLGKIPEWRMDEIRKSAGSAASHFVDPNISALRSVSVQHKYRMNVDRYIEAIIEGEKKIDILEDAKSAFMNRVWGIGGSDVGLQGTTP